MKTNRHIDNLLGQLFRAAKATLRGIWGLLLAFSLSCSTDDIPPIDDYGDYGYVIASLHLPQTRNVLAANNGDRTLHTIRIFVFSGENLEKQRLFCRIEDANYWNNPFQLRVTVGTKNVLVVANETPDMALEFKEIQTINGLYGVMADELQGRLFVFNESKGLPMTGRTDDVEVKPDPTGGLTIVTLTKMVARLDITITDGSEYGFKIEHIRLINNKSSSLLWDRSDDAFLAATEDDFFDINFNVDGTGASTDIAVNRVGDSWVFPPLYLYENLHGEKNRLKATKLEIKAILSFGNDDFPVIYDVLINDISSPEESRFLIQRGHRYTLRGTIWGTDYTHIAVKMSVEPWQEGNSTPQRPLPPLPPQ